jgi:hypothetical protein
VINRFFHSLCTCPLHIGGQAASRPLNRNGVQLVVAWPHSSGCTIHSLGLEFTVRSENSDGRWRSMLSGPWFDPLPGWRVACRSPVTPVQLNYGLMQAGPVA